MSRLIALIASLSLLGSLCFAGDACRKEAEAVYAKWCRLADAKDVKGMFGMLHPSFYHVDINGKKMTAENFKRDVGSMMPIVRNVKSKAVVEQCSMYGDELTAWITYSMKFDMKQGKKWVPTSFSMKQVETMRKGAKGWLFVHSQDLP